MCLSGHSQSKDYATATIKNFVMRIGGLEKQSFIDWEGKVVAVIFTKGCNFRCSYCHNPELVYTDKFQHLADIPAIEVFDYLASRKKWLDGAVITGGEPTILKDLNLFLKKIKQLGYQIKLDTNGSNPKVLKNLIEDGLIDYIAMDVKTILDLRKYQEICNSDDPLLVTKIKESIKILKESGLEYQLRTTIIPKYHSQSTIYLLLKEFSYCDYRLQEYRPIQLS